jgi:transposase
MEYKMQQDKLTIRDTEFIVNLKKLGISNSEIANKMGVSEGTVRYRIKRFESGAPDRRQDKPSGLDRYHEFIAGWIEEYKGFSHRPTLKALYELIRDHCHYPGSYDALRRYVRKHFAEFVRKGARIRIETPPGVLLQVDWKEDMAVQFARPDNWVKIHALCFSLSFSRKMVVFVSDTRNLPTFLRLHDQAFRKFGGLSRYIRTDCLKSAIVRWKGEKSILNERYKQHMDDLGITVFPSRPGVASDKGKIEKRIGDLFRRIDIRHHIFRDLPDLQRQLDDKLADFETQWCCGATGLSVAESFRYETKYLNPLPASFPHLPVKECRTLVRRDGTVYFDGNYYQVPQVYLDKSVLCMHTGDEIRIYHDGDDIGRFAYLPGAKGMVRLSETAISRSQIPMSETVKGWALDVARRQVEIYHELLNEGVR